MERTTWRRVSVLLSRRSDGARGANDGRVRRASCTMGINRLLCARLFALRMFVEIPFRKVHVFQRLLPVSGRVPPMCLMVVASATHVRCCCTNKVIHDARLKHMRLLHHMHALVVWLCFAGAANSGFHGTLHCSGLCLCMRRLYIRPLDYITCPLCCDIKNLPSTAGHLIIYLCLIQIG